MNHPLVAWGLVGAAFAAGWLSYGWRGLVLAATVVVFWLLLHWSRALRLLRRAAGAPVGQVASAVMLHSRLGRGQTLAQVIALTGSLGERVEGPTGGVERWRWRDAGGASVMVCLEDARVRSWQLDRASGETGP